MSKALGLVSLSAALLLATACVSDQKVLAERQGTALQTALVRGRSDLSCPTATALLLSSHLIQPAAKGLWTRGTERLEYSFGIEGCGEQTTVVVTCERGSGACPAADPDGRSPD